MQIEIRTQGIPVTAGMRSHVERRLAFALDRYRERVGRVTVRFGDVNGPRGGSDKTCRLDLTLRPGGTVRVADVDADLYVAIDRAAHRANRSVARRLLR